VIVNGLGAVEVDVRVTATPACACVGGVKSAVGAASADGAAHKKSATSAASAQVHRRADLDKGRRVQRVM
jgi:hypothetical protein